MPSGKEFSTFISAGNRLASISQNGAWPGVKARFFGVQSSIKGFSLEAKLTHSIEQSQLKIGQQSAAQQEQE
jgi:hypothetical protein